MKRSGNLLVQKSDGDVRNLSSAMYGRMLSGDRVAPAAGRRTETRPKYSDKSFVTFQNRLFGGLTDSE